MKGPQKVFYDRFLILPESFDIRKSRTVRSSFVLRKKVV